MNQFKRRCDVLVAARSGAGLDLSQLRIVFNVSKEDKETPNKARIKIYGVSEETIERVRREFVEVIIQAGYEENYGLIFRGNITQVRSGKEGGTDTYMEIAAGDGDEAYVFGTIARSLSAGATPNDIVSAAGIAPAGYVPDLGGTRLPRGKVMYGMKRDFLRAVADSTDTTWSVQDGKLQFVPLTGVLPGQAVVLNSKTGLVGAPEQTVDGIEARALLNPLLRIGGRVLINERDVQSISLRKEKKAEKKDKEPALIAADGQYRVIKITHTGDTRGQEWYSEMVCLDVDASAPPSKRVKR